MDKRTRSLIWCESDSALFMSISSGSPATSTYLSFSSSSAESASPAPLATTPIPDSPASSEPSSLSLPSPTEELSTSSPATFSSTEDITSTSSGTSVSSSSSSSHSSHSLSDEICRQTPISNLRSITVHTLATILDANNDWQKLMAIIPKNLNPMRNSEDGQLDWELVVAINGLKYTNRDIIRIEHTFWDPQAAYLRTQLLFEDWARSETPTLGILLQLCVKLELFDAADRLAKLLKERKPKRPEFRGDNIRKSPLLSQTLNNIVKISTQYFWNDDADLDRQKEYIPPTVWSTNFPAMIWNEEQQQHKPAEVYKIAEKTNEVTTFVTWHFHAEE